MKKSLIKKYHWQIILILTLFFVALTFFIDVKTAMIILFLLILILEYIIQKKKIGKIIIIALFFALFITSYYNYEYTKDNIKIGHINLFPLVAWTMGLVLVKKVYDKTKGNKYLKFAKICLTYWIFLFSLEFLGYWIFGIKLNSNFSSLLGLGVIHAQFGMKLFYVFAGPIYILVVDYLELNKTIK